MTKSLPVPWYFQIFTPSIEVPGDVIDEARGPVAPRLEPSDPRIPPKEGELPASKAFRPLHDRRDRVVERDAAGHVLGELSVPDGLRRREPSAEASVDQRTNLVEKP